MEPPEEKVKGQLLWHEEARKHVVPHDGEGCVVCERERLSVPVSAEVESAIVVLSIRGD